MPDPDVREPGLGEVARENRGDHAQIAVDNRVTGLSIGYSRALLSAMLQREEREEELLGDIERSS